MLSCPVGTLNDMGGGECLVTVPQERHFGAGMRPAEGRGEDVGLGRMGQEDRGTQHQTQLVFPKHLRVADAGFDLYRQNFTQFP